MSVISERKRVDEAERRTPRSAPAGEDRGRGKSATWPPAVLRKKVWLGGLFLVGGSLVAAAIATVVGNLNKPKQALVYYTVTRGDLPITVTERGNLESQSNVKVLCEVDDIQGDGINGTPILWIVSNGSSVKAGDLLVELDSSPHQERLDKKILDTERARAEQIQAKAKYDNQITQNDTNQAEAELLVELANLELLMFEDEEKGTHILEVEAIKRELEDINNQILEAQASLELKKNEMRGIESLFKLGYKGKSEVDRSRLEFMQAESQYAARMNKLKTQLATLEKKRTYEKEMQLKKLQGAVATAERGLKQVIRDNVALLDQAKAATEAADEALKKEEEFLARYREQLTKCKIYAPQDGMVAYSVSDHRWNEEVREGASMRERQHILSLPNLSTMQVKTAVHESVLDQIRAGLPATVRVDAFPDRSYRGAVQSVAVLPDQAGWMSSDTKVYKTVVTIDEAVKQLKPGMTAVVEIRVDRLRNVLSVPVQAVVQIEGDSWCYVDAGGNTERRLVQLGRTNDKFVEICKGIEEGERVVLNPMAIVDETKQGESEISPEQGAEKGAEERAEPPALQDGAPPAAPKPPGDPRQASSPDSRGGGDTAARTRPSRRAQPGAVSPGRRPPSAGPRPPGGRRRP